MSSSGVALVRLRREGTEAALTLPNGLLSINYRKWMAFSRGKEGISSIRVGRCCVRSSWSSSASLYFSKCDRRVACALELTVLKITDTTISTVSLIFF